MLNWLLRSRRFLAFAAALATASCAASDPNAEFLRKLEGKDFLKYAGANTEAMRASIREKGWPGIFGESGRMFGADGLSMAKGGVSHFIEKVHPFLETQGVKLPDLKDDLQRESYTLLVDGAKLPIWTREDLARELSDRPGITGGLAVARAFALVNELLAKANSKEHAYAIYSGAALTCIFLTDDLMTVIKADEHAVPKFIPYKPTTDYPSWGQPQK